MPKYLFLDKNTNTEFFETMTISERSNYLKNNPHIEQLVYGAPRIGYSTSVRKPDSGFRDVLKTVKQAHRGAKINTW